MRLGLATSGILLAVALLYLPTWSLNSKDKAPPRLGEALPFQEKIDHFRALIKENQSKEKNAIFADSLSGYFARSMQFDSAAWYAQVAASFFSTASMYKKVGDYFYGAYQLAAQNEKQELASRAKLWLEKAVALNPDDSESVCKIALTYISSEPMRGVRMLKDILKKEPDNQEALYSLGMLSMTSGQFELAIERLEKLRDINPRHANGQFLLGEAYKQTGQREKALQLFENIIKTAPDPALAEQAKERRKDLLNN